MLIVSKPFLEFGRILDNKFVIIELLGKVAMGEDYCATGEPTSRVILRYALDEEIKSEPRYP